MKDTYQTALRHVTSAPLLPRTETDMRLETENKTDQLALEGNTSKDAFSTPDDLESLSSAEDLILKYAEDPPALVAVMGVTGSGKTTFVNQVSKSYLKVGDDLESCTSEIQVSEEFILDGKRVVLIDTPGFDDTHQSDTDVLKSIAAFLGESYSAGVKLAGVIYVHRISDPKFGGLAVKNFKMFRELCGEKTLKNIVIVTNMWGQVTPEKGASREQQLKDEYFKAAIEKGARMCRHTNTPKSARAILRGILDNQPVVLKIQHELIDEHKDIGRTGAGVELKRDILEVEERYKREIQELEMNVRKAVEEKDEETRKEFEEERTRMQQAAEKLRNGLEEMQSKFEEARLEMEARMNARIEAQMVKLRETYGAEIQQYQERIKELESEGGDNTSQIKSLREKVAELHKKANEGWCIIS